MSGQVGFSPSLEELRSDLETRLRDFLAARRAELPEGVPLLDEIDRMLAAGGKRLRPAFCYWGFRAQAGKHGENIVAAAASLELLHTFAIVHDDIMDDSDERRGRPTVHVAHGVDFALLVGDLALVLADEMLFTSGFGPDDLARAFRPYSVMRQEVIAGQALDLEAGRGEAPSVEGARRIAIMKSGRYSIEKPLAVGAALAGATAGTIAALSRFGDPLGEAFQLRDDLLGTFGDRAEIGKPTDSDIREGKRNVLFALTAQKLRGDAQDFFLARWGGGATLSSEEVEALRDLVEASGARAATEELLEKCVGRALGALEEIRLGAEERAALTTLLHEAAHRGR